MRSTRFALLPLLFLFVTAVHADQPMCVTGPEHDEYLRSVLERPRERPRVAAHAAPRPVLRDGAVYLQSDDDIMPRNRPFNLDQQSLVFEPAGGTKFAVRRDVLRYIEPSGAPVRRFVDDEAVYERELGFELPLFGRKFTRIYVTRFNAIHFEAAPEDQTGAQFDELHAAVHRGPVVSPLMITTGKPRHLAYPALYVDETPSGIVLTWRSTEGASFGYDVQADLRKDGNIVFSYRAPRNMRWGTPVVSAGFDPVAAHRELVREVDDTVGDLSSAVTPQVRAMADIVRAEVARVDGTELFSVRVRLAAPLSAENLASDQTVEYVVVIGNEAAVLQLGRGGTSIRPFGGLRVAETSPTVQIEGDTIEFFILQRAPSAETAREVIVTTQVRPQTAVRDFAGVNVTFTPAPRLIASDLTALPAGTELTAPITQPFVLAPFDPWATWERVQSAFGISDYDVDAVAMYQTFFTDMIFYAGAYATGGNPQVEGIAPFAPWRGQNVPRSPTLLHMNQLTYNYSADPRTASRVMLHELGHRWLYFFSIKEDGTTSRVLNPTSAHPAGYVHTPSAFPIYGPEESSVMGGGYFRPESSGSWRTVAANDGFSWTDLYLMGLASAEEVTPWFYLSNATPQLPAAYWPPHDISVTGDRREVAVDQIIDVHGPRKPSSAMSQRQFRVLFVLVTEPGTDPTAQEIAKLDEWRALLARNFFIATGGRGSIVPSYVQPARKRAVR